MKITETMKTRGAACEGINDIRHETLSIDLPRPSALAPGDYAEALASLGATHVN